MTGCRHVATFVFVEDATEEQIAAVASGLAATGAHTWVKPGSRVTFLGQEEAYLVSGGEPLTPAAWLFLGPADAAAITYFDRVGQTPDIVFVSDYDVAHAGGYEREAVRDPLLRWVVARYRNADDVGGFRVYARR